VDGLLGSGDDCLYAAGVRRGCKSLGTAVAVASALLLAPAAHAASHRQTASAGAVSATITWRGEPGRFRDGYRIEIVRAGATLVDEPVTVDVQGQRIDNPYPGPLRGYSHSVLVQDMDGDGEPEVLIDAYSGGAHCCERTRVYRFRRGDYGFTTHQWGNQVYDLRDLDGDGRREFVSADDAFSYAFAAYAFSRWPILILESRGSRLVERTRDFPGAVRRDMRAQRHAYRVARRHHDVVGPALGAYAADLHHLGRHAEARRVVARALRRGELRRRHTSDLGPFGRAYVRRLNAILRNGGYLR
jgi:hypothetical protein